MNRTNVALLLPRHVRVLAVAYFFASLAHFAHNAEYIAFYPNMPAWITRETVYLTWIGITAAGFLGLFMLRAGFYLADIALVGVYGALGLYGLAHYALALCSEHTLAANITIWLEAGFGFLLMLSSGLLLWRRATFPNALTERTGG